MRRFSTTDSFARRAAQRERTVEVPEVRGPPHRPRPRREPPPECPLRVRLEEPLGAEAGGMEGVLVALEERAEHVHAAQIAQGLRRRAELDVIVGRRGGRAEQPVPHAPQEVRDRFLTLASELLDGARLVAHDAREVRRVEVVEPLVVGHGHAGPCLAVEGARAAHAELLPLPHGLRPHRERREDQDAPVGAPHDVLRPHELHRRLAEAAVGEERRAPLLDRPLHEALLEVEQEVGQVGRAEPVARSALRLALQEAVVGSGRDRAHAATLPAIGSFSPLRSRSN